MGWRAHRNLSHLSLPWSLLLTPSLSPLAGQQDGRGDRTDNADICGWEEVGHYNPICPCTCRQLLRALLYTDAAPHVAAGPLDVLHVVLNLIVASFGGGGGRCQQRRAGGGGQMRQMTAEEEEKEQGRENT